MKLLFYGDLHIRPDRIDDCMKVLREIRRISAEEEVDYVINLGDTFHTRGIIRTNCFDTLYQEFKKWSDSGIKQVILVGNHDQEDRLGDIHPLRVFGEFPSWHIADWKVFQLPPFVFIPYMSDHEILQKMIEKTSCKYLVTHLGIRGGMRNDKNIDNEGVPVEYFKKFRKVYSGHYHYRNSFANINYIGSPLQQDFGEMGQDKGVSIWEDGKVKFISIEGTPKHYEIGISWNEEILAYSRPPTITKSDFCRIKITGDAEQCSSMGRDKLEEICGTTNIKIDRQVREKAYSRLGIETSEIHNIEGLMEKYVDFVESGLNKKRLMKVGLEIARG